MGYGVSIILIALLDTGSLLQVFNVDRSNKTVVVEEGMTSSMVCHLLVVKNHFDESPNWVLVEQLGDVCLGEWVWPEKISWCDL